MTCTSNMEVLYWFAGYMKPFYWHLRTQAAPRSGLKPGILIHLLHVIVLLEVPPKDTVHNIAVSHASEKTNNFEINCH